MLPLIAVEKRQELLGSVSALYQRLASKSAVKLAVLDFIAKMFASPGFAQHNELDEAFTSGQEACIWLQASKLADPR